MLLKFRSTLGHIVRHEVVPNARNWYCTVNAPRIEIWVSVANIAYLVAGNFRWNKKKKTWDIDTAHYYVPPIVLGNEAQVQFGDQVQALDLYQLMPYVEPPYPSQEIKT